MAKELYQVEKIKYYDYGPNEIHNHTLIRLTFGYFLDYVKFHLEVVQSIKIKRYRGKDLHKSLEKVLFQKYFITI